MSWTRALLLLALLLTFSPVSVMLTGCLPGFYFTSGISCNRCPVDTYQDEISQTSCKRCSRGKKTFGKTGMTIASNCSGNYF